MCMCFTGGGAGSNSELNMSTYERYFDKPEVIHAYREQQHIQTPEYTLLSEYEAVEGQFRPRGQDDVRVLNFFFFFVCCFLFSLTCPQQIHQEGIDTSDAAYEKRHRKYKMFEKRRRQRKKQKLNKSSIGSKSASSSCMHSNPLCSCMSDSFFVASSPCAPPDEDGTQHDAPRPNGNVQSQSHSNGKWRKCQILDVASSLEARYCTLLNGAPVAPRAPEQPTPTPLAPPTPTPTPAPPPKLLEDEFELVMGLFEKATHEKTEFLHRVCHRITCSCAFNTNNLYLKVLSRALPSPHFPSTKTHSLSHRGFHHYNS